ncbi:hypothetical protein [Salegentibacter sp. BLCTC]|nr:hypothetical protein [Salegentibacter sp. BLCTC]
MNSTLDKIKTYLEHRETYSFKERKIIRTQLRNELKNQDNEKFNK